MEIVGALGVGATIGGAAGFLFFMFSTRVALDENVRLAYLEADECREKNKQLQEEIALLKVVLLKAAKEE